MPRYCAAGVSYWPLIVGVSLIQALGVTDKAIMLVLLQGQ